MNDVSEALEKLLARIDKELARQEAGTVAVGGLAKLGAALQGFLKACFHETCALHRVEPRDVLERVPRGSGDYLRALSKLGPPSGANVLVVSIIGDARNRRGRLSRLTDLRNVVTHEGRLPDPANVKRLLREVHGWLWPLSRS
jgi:hypothetical protein